MLTSKPGKVDCYIYNTSSKCRVQMVSSMVVICICCPKGCVSKHSTSFELLEGGWVIFIMEWKGGTKVTWKDPMINIFCSLLWVSEYCEGGTAMLLGKKVNIGTPVQSYHCCSSLFHSIITVWKILLSYPPLLFFSSHDTNNLRLHGISHFLIPFDSF